MEEAGRSCHCSTSQRPKRQKNDVVVGSWKEEPAVSVGSVNGSERPVPSLIQKIQKMVVSVKDHGDLLLTWLESRVSRVS